MKSIWGQVFAALGVSALIVVGVVLLVPAPNPVDKCEQKYYIMWSVNRCIKTTGCFTLQTDFYKAKQASQYYEAHCAQYEKDRISRLPQATIHPSEGRKDETLMDPGHASP